MSQPDPRALLELYLLGELGEPDARAVEAWLADAPEAEAELEAARRALAVLDAELGPPEGAEAFAERTAAEVDGPASRPSGPLWRWTLRVAAVAAIATLVVGLRALTRERYPEPRIQGSYAVADGGPLRRGAVLETGGEGAQLDLGDYCRVAIDPDSIVRIAGQPRDERIYLEQGRVLCDVDRQEGGFAVDTPLCTATVKGTRFVVELVEGGPQMLRKQALVRVLTGAVLVSGAWGQDMLAAGAAKVVPDEPPVEVAEPKPDKVREALAGFRGFIIGDLAEAGDEAVTLVVRAVTMVEGSTALNPGILLGKETQAALATEKDAAGNERPIPTLVATAKQLKQMPVFFAFGHREGVNNAVIVLDANAGLVAGRPNVTVHKVPRPTTMWLDGRQVRIGGGPQPAAGGADDGGQPRGPRITARVRADAEGKLVVDRVVPGSLPVATWGALPMLDLAGLAADDRRIHLEAEHIAIDRANRAARAQRQAELAKLDAQQAATQAQIRVTRDRLAMLTQQARAVAGLTAERAAQLEQQLAQAQARLAELEKRLAELAAARARLRRAADVGEARPPRREPRDTDF